MENRSSDKRSKISLDRVLREVAELENSRGEPDRIWSLSDIDDLLASTDTDSSSPADEDDTELLTSIQYYEGRYSDDDTLSESEPVYTQQGAEEPEAEIAAEPEPEIPSVAAEAATEPEIEESAESDDAEQTGKESDEIEESKASAGEISSSELNTSEEPVDETSSEELANEETAEAPAEPEKAEAAQESADEAEPEVGEAPVEEAAADESEDIYSDSKLELSVVKADGEDDDVHESDNEVDTDESDESNESDEPDNSDNILTLHGEEEEPKDEDEAEKKPTVEELFGAPASRYFGEPTEEPEEDSERESRAIPGLFGDTVVFGPMKSLSEPTQSKPDDEYKTKLMAAIGSAKAPQSAETIENPALS